MAEIPSHRLGDVERKVLTLHTLRELGGCGHLQLIRFMVEHDVMNYFELQSALYDLRETGQAARTPLAADEFYEITVAGEEVLAHFLDRAPRSLRDRVSIQAPLTRARFHQEREKPARISHEGHNQYHVILDIVEQNLPLMSLQISLPTAELAAAYRDRWGEQAQAIYDFIISRLAGEGEI